jgi:hypothetical protein
LQLKLQRNVVFAKYGKEFKDPELRDYFNLMRWYNPIGSSDPTLTDAEKETVALLLAQERRLKEARRFEYSPAR